MPKYQAREDLKNKEAPKDSLVQSDNIEKTKEDFLAPSAEIDKTNEEYTKNKKVTNI